MYKLYLMRREWRNYIQCRIGITSQSIGTRSVRENAVATWILEVIDQKEPKARAIEEYTAYNLGVPQTTWISVKTHERHQDWIDDVWLRTGNNWNRGQFALIFFDKDEDKPDWTSPPKALYWAERKERIARARSKFCNMTECRSLSICQHARNCAGTADRLVSL